MGSLPSDIINDDIPNGLLIAATIPADHLIVAGVSNWGGYGLVATMAAFTPEKKPQLLKYLNRDFDRTLLAAAVETGQAVDDRQPDRGNTSDVGGLCAVGRTCRGY